MAVPSWLSSPVMSDGQRRAPVLSFSPYKMSSAASSEPKKCQEKKADVIEHDMDGRMAENLKKWSQQSHLSTCASASICSFSSRIWRLAWRNAKKE